MPAKRLFMRQVREVLRLKWACGLSDRQIVCSSPLYSSQARRVRLYLHKTTGSSNPGGGYTSCGQIESNMSQKILGNGGG